MMSLASLLHVPDNAPGRAAFSFDHRMAHRTLAPAIPDLSSYSAVPYLLDPIFNDGKWHQLHQSAHQDFIAALPSYFGATVTGLPTSQPLEDTNLANNRKRTWWTFVNHQEHYTAFGTLTVGLL